MFLEKKRKWDNNINQRKGVSALHLSPVFWGGWEWNSHVLRRMHGKLCYQGRGRLQINQKNQSDLIRRLGKNKLFNIFLATMKKKQQGFKSWEKEGESDRETCRDVGGLEVQKWQCLGTLHLLWWLMKNFTSLNGRYSYSLCQKFAVRVNTIRVGTLSLAPGTTSGHHKYYLIPSSSSSINLTKVLSLLCINYIIFKKTKIPS